MYDITCEYYAVKPSGCLTKGLIHVCIIDTFNMATPTLYTAQQNCLVENNCAQ